MKLGKKEAKIDLRTFKLASIVVPDLPSIPPYFSVDKYFPDLKFPANEPYGNLDHGCCVKVTEFMYQLRAEAYEQGRVLQISEKDVLTDYYVETGGPNRDFGLVMLDSLNYHRKHGIVIGKKKCLGFSFGGTHYKIHAFASFDAIHIEEVKASVALLYGIAAGFMLPQSARDQLGKRWDFVDGPGGEFGSWGGHAVYIGAYEAVNEKTDDYVLWCYTWGKWQPMTYRFFVKYCDERYALVDRKDRIDSPIDEEKLEGFLSVVSK
jgi:hypothetical protein